jgi:hypothetical protein
MRSRPEGLRVHQCDGVTDAEAAWGSIDASSRGPELSRTEDDIMTTNVGGLDRILRIVVGLALIVLAATGTIGLWGYIGVVPLLTAALGTCPAYSLLGFSTCPVKTNAG